MLRMRPELQQWLIVAIFAAAMAWVEASVVYDLRTMIDRIQPFQPNPLPMGGALERVELVREAATLVMLLAVGMLAGRTWRSRAGYAAIAFGIWDIWYYIFLKMICGWPQSLLDWDVLFLMPVPWWAPVLAPISIAFLLIVWGTLINQCGDRATPICSRRSWWLSGLGSVLALYVFMADSLRAAGQGADARQVLPMTFNWPLFCAALVLMAASLVEMRERAALPAGSDQP